ncbi:glycosyltransferase family 4 protein [Accumulibacter sp.]|uniref:glycosyltransferase family 4 protein n=1 Tax=Accumulibacter sp. TaxID=2053492 RepID=UPI002608EB73|nr:glycosyltransferase family 4 protein [Accumulibacter sp.]
MSSLRIVLAHNGYQRRGGEDSVVDAEIALLRSNGHSVETYFRSNDDISGMSSLAVARQTFWSSHTQDNLAKLIRKFKPDVIHAHNTFPLISPSLYWVAERARVPVVQTLHNFRLMCLNALFLHDSTVCEDCMRRLPWRGVWRACYRDSRAASAVLGGTLVLHRGLGTYLHKVTRYIALSEFCRRKFIEGGLPASRIVLKPNFVDIEALPVRPRRKILFVGRLSREKGIHTLAEAIRLYPGIALRVVGDGPEAGVLIDLIGVTTLGGQPSDVVREEMSQAIALVLPSICYENFPRTIVEAFACGLPVIASRLGSMAELVKNGETGLLFEAGNCHALAEAMNWALAHPEEMAEMGRKARAQYEAEFSAEVNYRRLMAIYQEAIDEVKGARG